MYTYDIAIANFDSPVAMALAELIGARGIPLVAISENSLPIRRTNLNIARVVDPKRPEIAASEALHLLRYGGFRHLTGLSRYLLMWPYRMMSKLIPKKSGEVHYNATMLFY